MAGSRGSGEAVLTQHLEDLRAGLHRLEPHVRDDLPDAVHQLRVTCRRLRATLTTFRKDLDRSATEPARAELAWLGGVLGRARDLEVLGARLDRLVLAEDPRLVRGNPGPWLDDRLRAARDAAHLEVVDAMATDRYAALVAALDSWHDAPPWADGRQPPGRKRLARALDRQWTRMERAGAAAASASPGDRPARLHEVRKAAKRARYAAELLEPVLGDAARTRATAAERIQDVLGEHHDAVVAIDRLGELSDTAHAAGQDTFTFGVLCSRLEAEATGYERAFAEAWGELPGSQGS